MGVTVAIADIQPAFNNAHRVLWAKYHSGPPVLSRGGIRSQHWWLVEYNVTIHCNPHNRLHWQAAEFVNEQELIMFMLRWS